MTIEQKFGTLLQRKGNKIPLKINKFKQLNLSQGWHLFCFLIRRTSVEDFSLNFGFGPQKIRFGIFHDGIIHQLNT